MFVPPIRHRQTNDCTNTNLAGADVIRFTFRAKSRHGAVLFGGRIGGVGVAR
jgi:hypothetical protein